jgi:hypothetical protein
MPRHWNVSTELLYARLSVSVVWPSIPSFPEGSKDDKMAQCIWGEGSVQFGHCIRKETESARLSMRGHQQVTTCNTWGWLGSGGDLWVLLAEPLTLSSREMLLSSAVVCFYKCPRSFSMGTTCPLIEGRALFPLSWPFKDSCWGEKWALAGAKPQRLFKAVSQGFLRNPHVFCLVLGQVNVG